MFDVKTHVPLFVKGWEDNGEYGDLVGLADLPTTLLDVCGLPVPDTYQGHSLRSLIAGNEWPREDVIGGRVTNEGEYTIAVREEKWKLIRHPNGEHELYDLESDPAEQTNVYNDYPAQVKRLDKKLDKHLDRVADSKEMEVTQPDVGEDVKERLRRLGYDE